MRLLEEVIKSRPWAIHKQRSEFLFAACGVEVSETTIWRAIKKHLSHSRNAPCSEVVEDGLPRRVIVRQKAPRTATPQDVEDSVEDFALVVNRRSAKGFWGGKMGFQAAPFGIGEVGRVRFSHAC
jgi:hypothetical protein